MGRIQVQTPELALASNVIGNLGASVQDAQSAVSSASSEGGGAFGGEAVGETFLSMCAEAERAVGELGQTVDELSRNVAMAAVGYLNTDLGVIPIDRLTLFGGYKP